MMKVPALVDGDTKVAESCAVLAYLAERFPEAGLAPAVGDPARGDYLRWLFFAAGCVEAAFTQVVAKVELASMSAGWGTAERVFDEIEAGLARGPWLLGDAFSAADVAVGASHYYGTAFKIVPERPAFADYVTRCTARPAFARAQAINAAAD